MQFEEKRKGYDPEQVDQYIQALKKEYQNLLNELEDKNEELDNKNSELESKQAELGEAQKKLNAFAEILQENDELDKKNRALTKRQEGLIQEKKKLEEQVDHYKLSENPTYSDAIASALVSAEMSAKQIIANAKKEAELIGDATTRELSDIVEAKQAALGEIRKLSGRLLQMLKEEERLKNNQDTEPPLLRS